MIGYIGLVVASPLSGFRVRSRIGRTALLIAALVATAAIALSFPATTASDTCAACGVSGGPAAR